jgi:hypothetical protein
VPMCVDRRVQYYPVAQREEFLTPEGRECFMRDLTGVVGRQSGNQQVDLVPDKNVV